MTREMVERLYRKVESRAAAAYRDVLRYGYSRPAVVAVIEGVLRPDEDPRGRAVIRAVDLTDFLATARPVAAAELEANLAAGPAGRFACFFLDDADAPPHIVWYPLPDRN